MLIALVYRHFGVSIAHYFKRSFKRRSDIDTISIGVAYGRNIPWQGGMVLPYEDVPDIPIPEGDVPWVYIESQVQQKYGKPADVIIVFNAAYRIDGRPSHSKYLIVGTDGHCVPYDRDRASADALFNMHEFYAQPGDVILPYAYDPEFHAPLDRPKEYDACLIGVAYEHRVQWVNALRGRGVNVCFQNGPAYKDAQELYARSTVGLNWSSLQDLNARAFEVPAMGLPLVQNTVPDLPRYFNHTQTIGFSDNVNNRQACIQGATDAVVNLLSESEKIKSVAAAGHQAVKPHTYDARVATILNHIGI